MKSALQKKTYNLDAAVIQRLRRLYDAKTDSEAIRRALDKAIEDHEIQHALEQLLKRGRFRSVYR
jgi:hypothetical protein